MKMPVTAPHNSSMFSTVQNSDRRIESLDKVKALSDFRMPRRIYFFNQNGWCNT
jgi:hypothetical protein